MAPPPASGPSSDIEGGHQDTAQHRKPDPAKGIAKEIDEAEKQSKGRPKYSGGQD